jgi:demethylmenaquinone methyltransferase / 2-methoxy-6-polyprenyl-1,4-benzoquinol methylase
MVTPYGDKDKTKKQEVAEMFDNIAPKYDFLNHLLSMGIDIGWRRKAIKILKAQKPKSILDVATGTADFAIEALDANPDEVIGVDISKDMLAVGRTKISKKGFENKVRLDYGDAENLPYETEKFDAITVAFGVRNFENLEAGLTEMNRVLKKGKTLFVIEFSKPEHFPIKQLYFFYFKAILPLIGKLVSKDARAYTYLPESVEAFPYGNEFAEILKKCGFSKVEIKPLTFGIASLYVAEK